MIQSSRSRMQRFMHVVVYTYGKGTPSSYTTLAWPLLGCRAMVDRLECMSMFEDYRRLWALPTFVILDNALWS